MPILNGLLQRGDTFHNGDAQGLTMNAAAPDLTYFSTDALPERDRIAVWREVFGRYIVRAHFEVLPDAHFSQTAIFRHLPGLSLVWSTCAGLSAERTRELTADSDDDLVLTINTEGVAHASQFGQDMSIAPGEGVLLSAADVGRMHYPRRARFVAISMPRRVVAAMVGGLDARLARRLPKDTEALRLLIAYLTAVDHEGALTSPELRQVFATHVRDLVALAIGATRDAAMVAKGRGLQAARLNAIKTEIIDRLDDEGLSVAEVAKRHQVTPRYVQMLFESDGGTFSEYVIEQRLTKAHRMLTDPRFMERAVSAIAFEVGFGNLSYFNRVFRRRYGATPSDVRDAARRERPG